MPEVRFVGSTALIAKGMQNVVDAVAQSAETMAADAQRRAPVRTGTLRASIHTTDLKASGSEVSVRVATGGEANEYAVFQELGTSRMGAHPYMLPALLAHEPLHRKILDAAWKGAF